MISGIRILNAVLIALVALAAVGAFMSAPDLTSAIPAALGACLWMIAPLMTIRAIGTRSTVGNRKRAVRANVIAGAFLILIGVGLGASTGEWVSLPGLAVIALPLAFNIAGIRKKERLALEEESAGEQILGAESSPEAEAVRELDEGDEDRNYFVRHWRGSLSLPISYWVNGSLLGIAMAAFFTLIGEVTDEWSLRAAAFAGIVALVLALVVTVWSSVGVWRSATRHPDRGGSPGWAGAAKVVTGIGIFGLVVSLFTAIGPQMREYVQIATGNDELGRIEATLTADGSAIVLQGMFGEGSASDVLELLEISPGVRTLVLASGGGRIREAEIIAKLVRERGLNTYVEYACESACTYVFLAGVDRAATPNALIGFHQPSFPGLDAVAQAAMTRDMLDFYRNAGITNAFLERVAATSPDSMWYPTREELILNSVINRTSLGGETSFLTTLDLGSRDELADLFRDVPLYEAIDVRFPGSLDKAIEAAWQQYQSGASDGAIEMAVRQVMGGTYPMLLRQASDASIEEFVGILVDQMEAAKAISNEACGALLASRLDPQKVLPADLVQRELNWALATAQAEPFDPLPVPSADFYAAIGPAAQGVPEDMWPLIRAPGEFENSPGKVCEALLLYYRNVLALPVQDRFTALRGMFQGTR